MLRSLILTMALGSAFAVLPSHADDQVAACASAACGTDWVYFGTRHSGEGQGIYAARFDAKSGHLSPIGLVADIARPTWLTAHPKLPVLYSSNSINVFAVDPASGKLTATQESLAVTQPSNVTFPRVGAP